MKTLNKLMLSFLLTFAVLQAFAYDFQEDDLRYTIISANPPEVSVSGHANGTSAQGSLTIPETVSHEGVTYTVTEIGERAFQNCESLSGDLVIPNTVRRIETEAFECCSGFHGTLTLSNQLVYVGYLAFHNCYNLQGTLTLPESLDIIDRKAFIGCSGFTGPLALPQCSFIGAEAFRECSGFTGDIVIPISITHLENGIFAHCTGFDGTIVLHDNIENIGNGTFRYCSGLTGELVIPESVTFIDIMAFYDCENLTGTLNIPSSVVGIGASAFAYCYGFTGELVLPESIIEIPHGAFKECVGLTSVVIPNTVTKIGQLPPDCFNKEGAFEGCTGLTGTLQLPENLIRIGGMAFKDCTGLTGELVFPASLQRIDAEAFKGCIGLTGDLVLPVSVSIIEPDAFRGCTGFSSLQIKNAVSNVNIMRKAFYGCTGMHDIEITEQVSHIGSYAFAETGWEADQPNGVMMLHDWCLGYKGNASNLALQLPETTRGIADCAFTGNTNIKSLSIPDDCPMTKISDSAFYGCNKLAGLLTIPNGIKTIGQSAFERCSKIKNLELAPSVETLDYFAFDYCTGLEIITSWAETPPLVKYSFYDVNTDIPLKVPCGTMEAYQNNSQWSAFTNISEVPFKLTVSVDHPDHGTCSIVKHGDCDNPESIVQATPNNGHEFAFWAIDGDIVSYDQTYTFNLEHSTALKAHFDFESVGENDEYAFAVYPNPGKDVLNIRTGLKDARVEVYDMSGRMVYGQEITENVTAINADAWPAGIYVWKMISDGKEVENGKWIKE